MSDYKKKLLELAESLRIPFWEQYDDNDGVIAVGGNDEIVNELVALINLLEVVEND